MGLFSSKSSSSSTTHNQSSQLSGTIGDLSTDNVVAGGDYSVSYNPKGLAGSELNAVLSNNQTLLDKTIDVTKESFDSLVAAVQQSTETAINTAATAYADATGTTKSLFDNLKPFAFYGLIGFVFWAIMKGK